MAEAFHDVLFPLPLGFGASGGPERRTEIVALASGHEQRNSRWAGSRRRWNVGTGLRSRADLATLVAFFEAREGRLAGFRFRDPLDHSSAASGEDPSPSDQRIGTGDGSTRAFYLGKAAGGGVRPITRPVAGSVRLALDGVLEEAFALDAAGGRVLFDQAPAPGVAVTAGFRFDVPVRFDTDRLLIDLSGFDAGAAPDVPILEIREGAP